MPAEVEMQGLGLPRPGVRGDRRRPAELRQRRRVKSAHGVAGHLAARGRLDDAPLGLVEDEIAALDRRQLLHQGHVLGPRHKLLSVRRRRAEQQQDDHEQLARPGTQHGQSLMSRRAPGNAGEITLRDPPVGSRAPHKHRASFETRADARSSGGGKWVMAQRKSPHPEEATKGPSRRTHGSRSRVIANISLPPRSAILEPDSRGTSPAMTGAEN